MSKMIKMRLITMFLAVSLVLSLSTGCAIGSSPLTSPARNLDVVQEAWGIISEDYVERDKVDASALSHAAIKSMVEALNDPYSSYLDANTYQLSLMSSIAGKFEGIGAFVGIRDKRIVIIAPISDSPAAKAGILPGDVILEISGESTANMSAEEAIVRVRGPKGTPVRLLILHQGETQPQQIVIVRAEIKLASVRFEMKEDIAYIDISHFSERTNEELSPVLTSLTQQNARGIIIDLRGNGGGPLQSVVDVAGRFLKEGIVVSWVDNQGKRTSRPVKPAVIATDLPMVVLTDNYSASASEVLAGALQDYDRATIAGTKSYGKGSVNTLHELQDGSALYITTGRWFTPKGRLIEGKGINPDYALKLTGDELVQWAIDYLKGKKG
ncbi:MAG: family peptidase [Dehalococcoidales bacterium]|nr:family peptidase [Dehalococcoidales bacterium]